MSRFDLAPRLQMNSPGVIAVCAMFSLFTLAGCLDALEGRGTDPDNNAFPPVIVYAGPVADSIGDQYVLTATSTGGQVTHFSISPALPDEATFDAATGRIMYVLPGGWPDWKTHMVIATGPGGADTSEVEIPFSDRGQISTNAVLVLSLSLNAIPLPAPAKPAVLRLDRLIISLTSNIPSDPVLRDTILATDALGGVLSVATATPQQILKNYAVKPLRTWTIEVKTLDAAGEIMHHGTAMAEKILIGETRAIAMTLANRLQPMVALFRLPDTLSSSDPLVTAKQAIFFKRLVMVVSGDTVADSTASGWFPTSPRVSALTFDHARADTAHTVAFFVYADSLGRWPVSSPVYRGQFSIPRPDSTYALTLQFSGPGSVWDPNYDPSNPVGQLPGLVVEYGGLGGLIISPPIPPNVLPKR
jgi:hypothetical protein